MNINEEETILNQIDPGFALRYKIIRCLMERLSAQEDREKTLLNEITFREQKIQALVDHHSQQIASIMEAQRDALRAQRLRYEKVQQEARELNDKLQNDLTDPAVLRRQLKKAIKAMKRG